jgi:hypothetical protein
MLKDILIGFLFFLTLTLAIVALELGLRARATELDKPKDSRFVTSSGLVFYRAAGDRYFRVY